MFARLNQMLIKEFIQVFRDKRTRIILIVPPIVQMLVFGYAATFEIRHVSTAVLDLDHSQESRELLSRFSSSPYFDVQRQLTSSQQIRDLIDSGSATIGLEIDAGFAQKLQRGETAPLQVIVDATNSNTALIASAYVSQIALGFAQQAQQDRIQRIAPQFVAQTPSVSLEERPWYNASLSSRWFFVPGVIGSLTLVLVITLTAFAVVREREIGTLEQIMVTPIRPVEF
ncbi:MAG: ABC transporter permease, partial [Terracidiphilus sp.]